MSRGSRAVPFHTLESEVTTGPTIQQPHGTQELNRNLVDRGESVLRYGRSQ